MLFDKEYVGRNVADRAGRHGRRSGRCGCGCRRRRVDRRWQRNLDRCVGRKCIGCGHRCLGGKLASVKELASQKDTTYIVQTVKDSNNLDAIKLVLGNSVLFSTGSSNLSAAAQAALGRVAYNLKQFPNTDVTVVGFTDNTGSEALNQRLSLERAQSVMTYLVSLGIPQSRLKAIGEGWNNPIASNATSAGRAQNRRVELFITADQQMIENAQSAQ